MTTPALLDIPTIYLLTGFSSLVGSGILLWLRAENRDSGPALYLSAAGILALGIGFACFALRSDMIGWVASVLGYAAFGVASILIWLGVAHLHGGRPPHIVATIALLVYVCALLLLRAPTAPMAIGRIVLNGAFVAIFIALAARETHRSPWIRQLRSVRLLRGLLLLFCTIILVRMLMFVFSGIALHPDGSASGGVLRALFAAIFGSMPFAITVAVLSIANSQLSARLRRMASTDDLTGLVSRRQLQDSGQRMLGASPQSGCIALLMIDVDRFKTINDRYGHQLGDQVLRHVASVLQQSLRPDSLIVRYGGDEFCALVPIPGEAAAFVVAERLRAAMEATPYRLEGQRIPITLSIGVSVHRHGATLRQLLDEADRRAYRAKADGRNRVVADDLPA